MELPQHISYELSDQQFIKALNRYWFRAFVKRGLLAYGLLLLVACLVTLADSPLIVVTIIWSVIGMSVLVQIVSYFKWRYISLTSRKRLNDHMVHVRVGRGGLIVRSDIGTSDLNWRAFTQVWKYPDMWLLFVAKHQFVVLLLDSVDPEVRSYIDQCVTLGAQGGTCSECGYDLRGQSTPRCPECGVDIEEQRLAIVCDGRSVSSQRQQVYLAGPMSGYEQHNVPAFNQTADRLRDQGYSVFNPADQIDLTQRQCRAYYMRRDIPALMESDLVALLPGWRRSRGANLEVWIALDLDIPVYSCRQVDGTVSLIPVEDLDPFDLPFAGGSEPASLDSVADGEESQA